MYRILGELRIGPEPDLELLPGGRTLILLAVLLMNPNQLVLKEQLIRAAWGDRGAAEGQLHKHVGKIRELLARVDRRDDLRTHAQRGYELRLSADDLDSLLFLKLVGESEQARRNRRKDAEIELLRRALDLWRGPRPVSNVVADVFRRETDLEKRRKRAAVRLVDLELAQGAHDQVLDELIQLTGDYPTDGPLCQRLMLAFYRSGHATDALETYARYRERLEEERAGEPEPRLRDLHYAIGRGDDEAVAAVAGGGLVAIAVPRQLPAAIDLVGRDDLLAELRWLLRRDHRVSVQVTVVSGPGGSGKTALAVRAAQESSDHYPDGQLYAQLRTTAGEPVDLGELLAQFLRAFGVARIPKTPEERLSSYRTLLADRRVLVLLDDAVDENQVRNLVPPSPGSAVVVTARRRLPDLAGVHHVAPLEPLERPEATALFLTVVRDAGITLPENDGDAVDRVVGLCGGLPLAVRIAGALRARDHPRSTTELADRLARQGPEGFAYGSHSVARTISAGYERLEPDAQRLFLGLGLLRLPDFWPWTASALLSQEPGAADALSELAADFLVQPVEGRPRYRFHDLTRDYAGRRAEADLGPAAVEVPARGYRALLTLARHAHAGLYGGDYEVVHSDVPDWPAPPELLEEITRQPLDWFERERANVRAAVEHCAALGLTATGWDLAVSAHEFYTIRGYVDDWYATNTQALLACQSAGDRRGEGILLACLGQPALVAGHRGGSLSGPSELERAVVLLTECGDRHGQAIALRTLANALRRSGHLTRPLALFTEALAHYEASADLVGRWQTLRFIGQTHLDLGDHADALRILQRAAAVAVELGRTRLLAQSWYWVGQAQLAVGDAGAAERAFRDVRAALGDDQGVGLAYALHGLGDVAARRAAYEQAEQRLNSAADLARGSDAVLQGRIELSRAAVHETLARPDRQLAALKAAAAYFASCGAAYLQARALAALASAHSARGDHGSAVAAWQEVEDLYVSGDVPAGDRILPRPNGLPG